ITTSYSRSGSIGPTRPTQRASCDSLGLRSSWPPGHSTIGSSSGSISTRSNRTPPPTHPAARTQHDRNLLRLDLEPFDQHLPATILGGVEALVGVTVAPQEIDQPQHVSIRFMADDDPTHT